MGATYYVANGGSDTSGDGSAGNPYATPSKANAVAIAAASAGYTLKVVGGTYSISIASSNVSGGVLNCSLTGSQAAFNRIIGVTSTSDDTPATWTMALGSGVAATVLTTNNANSWHEIRNLAATGNATSGSSAVNHNGRSNRIIDFKASGFTGGGQHIVQIGSNAYLSRFEISGGATSNFAAIDFTSGAAYASRGWVHGNAGRGVDIGGSGVPTLEHVASTDHTGANGIGFQNVTSIEAILINCVADNNAQSNYQLFGSGSSMVLRRCISTRAGSYDINNLTGPNAVRLEGFAYYRASGTQWPTTPDTQENVKVLTAMPYTGSGDYNLNTTTGGGALCRGIGYTSIGITGTSYEDFGVMQHQDSGGSGAPAETAYWG